MRALHGLVLSGFFAVTTSAVFAQTGGATQSITIVPGTGALKQSVPATPAAPTQPVEGGVAENQGPANLCEELLAFMKAPPPEAAPASGTASATAASAKAQGGSAQQASGQGGVAVEAPKSNVPETG